MTDFLLEYDESADAACLQLTDAAWDHQQRLDDARVTVLLRTLRGVPNRLSTPGRENRG